MVQRGKLGVALENSAGATEMARSAAHDDTRPPFEVGRQAIAGRVELVIGLGLDDTGGYTSGCDGGVRGPAPRHLGVLSA